MEKIELINKDVEDEFNIEVEYVKIKCCRCSNSWGASCWQDGQIIDRRSLTCEKCAAEKVAKNY
jgi:hypothetical protein